MSIKMVSNDDPKWIVEVQKHIILRNGWEYYVTELPDEDGIGMAYVLGFENEFGSFSQDEIAPYIVSQTSLISSDPESEYYLMPADGFRWLEAA